MEKRYTCKEVAALYGVKTLTVWSWIRKKQLSAVRIGKLYAVRPEDLEAFEKKGRLTKPVRKEV